MPDTRFGAVPDVQNGYTTKTGRSDIDHSRNPSPLTNRKEVSSEDMIVGPGVTLAPGLRGVGNHGLKRQPKAETKKKEASK